MMKHKENKPREAGVSISAEIDGALVVATKCFGTSQSQYIRQALMERLIREQFLPHPMHAQSGKSE
jgi:hypothetical protein